MNILTALGLGLITVIHPCPLSTNISAVTLLLGLQYKSQRKILLAGAFLLGEILTFTFIGILLAFGGFNMPLIANTLQSIMQQLIGPILIIIGMMLSGILFKNQHTLKITERFVRKNSNYSVSGGFVLGILVALSFCPMTAALFFGVLIPLAISNNAVVLYPVFFGIGSAIPLVIITAVFAKGSSRLEKIFFYDNKKRIYIKIAGTAVIFLGIYFSLKNIFDLL